MGRVHHGLADGLKGTDLYALYTDERRDSIAEKLIYTWARFSVVGMSLECIHG